MYGDSHRKDKTGLRPFYRYNGNPYTGKTMFLYWENLHVPTMINSWADLVHKHVVIYIWLVWKNFIYRRMSWETGFLNIVHRE